MQLNATTANKFGPYFLITLIFFVAELLVNPLANFPLNDDWSFAKALLKLNKGELNIGDWPAMSLLTHLLWGLAFIKVLGFSFNVLRFSVLIAALLSALLMYRTVQKYSNNRSVSVLAALTLLLNPVFFNTSNTYMTDVTFNFFLIITVVTALAFFESSKNMWFWFALFFISSTLLVFLRQLGIVAPVCFALSCLFLPTRKWLYVMVSLLMITGIIALLYTYELHLRRVLEPTANYKFMGEGSLPFEGWSQLFHRAGIRMQRLSMTVFIYVSPFAVLLFRNAYAKMGTKKFLLLCLVSIVLVIHFYDVPRPLIGNVFMNLQLGPETMYENWVRGSTVNGRMHSELFDVVLDVAKYLCCFCSMFALLYVMKTIWRRRREFRTDPGLRFILLLGAGYAAILLLPNDMIDRYMFPLLTIAIILLAGAGGLRFNYAAVFFLVAFSFVSICGTRDYMNINRIVWDARNRLIHESHTDHNRIHGGFEMAWWADGQEYGTPLTILDFYDYLIQFKPEPDFVLQEEYPFLRTLSMRRDTIKVYRREVPIKRVD